MKKNLFVSVVALMSAAVFISSCQKDDSSVTPSVGSVVTLNASAYDKWVYFSFETGAEVAITDFKNSTDWDIAFHRGDVRVNCGAAGVGQGGSFNAGKVDFASVKEAPATGYSLNTTIKILESYTMPPVYVTVPGDTLVTKWLTVIPNTNAKPTYIPQDYIYVIKTAKGKYAKVWLKDYFNEAGTGGYITMKYAFQADGSRKFE
jgi:hypothetical protein